MNRLIQPASGRLFINGTDINTLSSRNLRALRAEKIDMVFQNMALMPHRSVLENVGVSLEVRQVDKAVRHQIVRRGDNECGVIQFLEWYTATLRNRFNEQPETLASPLVLRKSG